VNAKELADQLLHPVAGGGVIRQFLEDRDGVG
jgi:hypothetical protein